MILPLITLIFWNLIFSCPVWAEKIVYGDDGRFEFADIHMPELQNLKKSFAAMIHSSRLKLNGNEYLLDARRIQDEFLLCPDVLFSQQYKLSDCSGFLVAPDIVATAGHCVVNEITCLENVWTFGLDKTSGQSRKINKREIYRCKELISSRTDHVTKNDFALVRLDRAVVGARPLKLSAINSVLSTQAEYIVVGHPSGLPLKVSIGGKIVDNSQKHYFRMEADTFAGNSGAAVLSLPELEVVGILVRGSLDFKFDRFEGCSIVNRCEEVGKGSDCSGESATRISELTPFLAAPD